MEEIHHQASDEGWSGTFRNNVHQEASLVLTWNESTDGNLLLSEIHQAVNTEVAILSAGKGGVSGREILV